ncbi:MAG: site-specific integrase [Tetragenococcus halophilus]|nr:site-specific integrase [Atopostipes sp.]MDN6164357.1 site-specific integrase [Tetragenococcus halophilus]MDN6195485.1 site-specific integrase [Atopostipes suicloacalis]MDN6736213.1 site-specific integrase [Tetragenococcus koreensis]
MAEPKKVKNGYKMRIRIKNPITKKWIEKQRTFKTKKECRDWEANERTNVQQGIDPNKTKLLDFFDLWFETFKKNKVGEERKKKILTTRRYLFEFFGENYFINDLNKITYQKFINFLSNKTVRNNPSGKQLSKETVKDYHKVCKSVFIEAVDNGILRFNPARKSVINGRDTSGERKKELSMDEWKKLLESVSEATNSSSKFATLTMMFIGARFEEINGLLETDVDLKNNQISINKAFDYKRKKDFKNTKNFESKRTVDMPAVLSAILKDYLAEKNYKKKIVSLNHRQYLFPNDLGEPITNAAINKFITKRCKSAEIERVTSHAFRHTRTDMLVLAGADMIYTQKQLGHKNASTTLEYYSSLSEDIQQKNRTIQDDFINNIVQKK